MQQEKFSIIRQIKSFKYAFNGIKDFIITEHNARIHLTATIAVIIASFLFHISLHEWMMIIFAIGFVWSAEMFNTCIEKTMDFISTEIFRERFFQYALPTECPTANHSMRKTRSLPNHTIAACCNHYNHHLHDINR